MAEEEVQKGNMCQSLSNSLVYFYSDFIIRKTAHYGNCIRFPRDTHEMTINVFYSYCKIIP